MLALRCPPNFCARLPTFSEKVPACVCVIDPPGTQEQKRPDTPTHPARVYAVVVGQVFQAAAKLCPVVSTAALSGILHW